MAVEGFRVAARIEEALSWFGDGGGATGSAGCGGDGRRIRGGRRERG